MLKFEFEGFLLFLFSVLSTLAKSIFWLDFDSKFLVFLLSSFISRISNLPSSLFSKFWSSFSSIFETLTKVSLTDFSSSFSSTDCSLLSTFLSFVTSTTWSVVLKFVFWPSDDISISPTSPKLSSARATLDFPSFVIPALNLVPLTPSD